MQLPDKYSRQGSNGSLQGQLQSRSRNAKHLPLPPPASPCLSLSPLVSPGLPCLTLLPLIYYCPHLPLLPLLFLSSVGHWCLPLPLPFFDSYPHIPLVLLERQKPGATLLLLQQLESDNLVFSHTSRNVSTTTGCIAMKCGTNIHDGQRMNSYDFLCSFDFYLVQPTIKSFHLSNGWAFIIARESIIIN